MLYNFGNSTINTTEAVKLPHAKPFLICRTFVRHVGVACGVPTLNIIWYVIDIQFTEYEGKHREN